MHILIESIDGAGKGTVVPLILDELKTRGLETLSVAEPTHAGIGKFIREEIIAQHADGHRYTGLVTAQMFAVDREVLYTETIIPWKNSHPNGVVVQDRGALSSLTYQPLQDPEVKLDWLLELRGNKIELAHAPDALFILRIDPTEAARRLAIRTEKQDKCVFEKQDFQEKLASRYLDPEVQAPYLAAKTKIFVIDAGGTREEVGQRVKEALQAVL
jgi:dTMP kinase